MILQWLQVWNPAHRFKYMTPATIPMERGVSQRGNHYLCYGLNVYVLSPQINMLKSYPTM